MQVKHNILFHNFRIGLQKCGGHEPNDIEDISESTWTLEAAGVGGEHFHEKATEGFSDVNEVHG